MTFMGIPVRQGATRLGLLSPVLPMRKVIDILEAKRHFSRILEDVAAGAEIVIGKAGKPVVRRVPIAARPRSKRLGLLSGHIQVPDDFNAPLALQALVGS